MLNRKLFEYLTDIKDSKLERLTPSQPVITSYQKHQPSYSRQVVTIPPDLDLTVDERKVLSKGLNRVPVEEQANEFDLRRNLDAFYRRIRLTYHFQDQENSDGYAEDTFDTLQRRRSSWTPPEGESRTVDKFIDKCRDEIEPLKAGIKAKPTIKHNLSKGEKITLKKLKSNDNIIIKSADKGGLSLSGTRTYMFPKDLDNYLIPLPTFNSLKILLPRIRRQSLILLRRGLSRRNSLAVLRA